MSRYLVTGGAGFIGSHLVDRLAEAGETIRVVDDLSTGHRQNLIQHDISTFEFIEADLAEPGVAIRARSRESTTSCTWRPFRPCRGR